MCGMFKNIVMKCVYNDASNIYQSVHDNNITIYKQPVELRTDWSTRRIKILFVSELLSS